MAVTTETVILSNSATTSNACGDNHNLAETSNLLLAEISKESRKTVIAKMKDARIELIRELAWVSTNTRVCMNT